MFEHRRTSRPSGASWLPLPTAERPTPVDCGALPELLPNGLVSGMAATDRMAPDAQPARCGHRRSGPAPPSRGARRPGCRHHRVAGLRGGRHPRRVLRPGSVHDAWPVGPCVRSARRSGRGARDLAPDVRPHGDRSRSVRMLPLALALVGGLLIGQRLGLTTAISDDAVLLRPDIAPFHLGMTILVGIGAILFMAGWWPLSLWLPVATRLRSPTIASLPVAVGAAAILTIAIAVFEIVVTRRSSWRSSCHSLNSSGSCAGRPSGGSGVAVTLDQPEMRVLVEEPLMIACLPVIVVVPWAAAPLSSRSRSRPVAAWGRANTTPDPPIDPASGSCACAGRWVSDSPQASPSPSHRSSCSPGRVTGSTRPS